MANSQIPNLPAIAAASGSDLYETVQGGVSSKVTLTQLVTYFQSQLGSGVTGLSFGTIGLLPNVMTGGAITVSGTLVEANGGTGKSSYAVGDILVGSGAAALSKLSIGASGLPLVSNGTTLAYAGLTVPGGGTGLTTITAHSVLLGNGTGAINPLANGTTGQVLIAATGADPAWGSVSTIAVSTISFGTTGLTPSSPTSGAITVAGVLNVANGGSGLATRTAHAIQVGNGTSAVTQLAVGTTGQILTGSTGADPVWSAATSVAVTSLSFGTTGLTPSIATQGAITVAGTLVVANGGTGLATLTAHSLQVGNGTGNVTQLAVGTTGQYLKGSTGADPVWGTLTSDVVTSISFGTTGLTPSTGTTGAITVAGTLVVSNGGTGVGTLTGIVKGNGTSAFSAATAGTDYVAPATATTFTATQTFNGSASTIAMKVKNVIEPSTQSATAATGTINFDVLTQSILYYTSNASANWTVNVRGDGTHTLDSLMATGDEITIVFKVTQGASPFFNNAFQIDGNAVTPKWQGGTAPSTGNASGVDVYTYNIAKTASATFTVFASQTQFK